MYLRGIVVSMLIGDGCVEGFLTQGRGGGSDILGGGLGHDAGGVQFPVVSRLCVMSFDGKSQPKIHPIGWSSIHFA